LQICQDNPGNPAQKTGGLRLSGINLPPALHLSGWSVPANLQWEIQCQNRFRFLTWPCNQTREAGLPWKDNSTSLQLQFSGLLVLWRPTSADQTIDTIAECHHQSSQLLRFIVQSTVDQHLALATNHDLETALKD